MDPLIRNRLATLGIVCIVSSGVCAAQASAQRPSGSTKLVTYAARVCNSYTDVTANLARNDIQESLRDLGPDTLYTGGEPIAPAKEAAGQPACRPLPAWVFTLGTNYQTRAVSGPWGSLSKVLNPYSTSIVTQPSVPLLDAEGKPTGGSLQGAVTVALTNEQAARASRGSSLWVQGGTPADPVLDQTYPGEYGFAALRCGIDNLNGDNVEWIAYPTGANHVFCYAYYVKPPPTSGTIIVRKVVDDPEATSPQSFTFSGNISYTEDHRFSIASAYGAPQQTSFYRGAVGPGDAPWTITEEPPQGWVLKGLDCVSATGTSTTTTDVQTGQASVTLAGGDTVTCTYTDGLEPPPATLQLAKRTIGGIGRFDYSVSGPDSATRSIETTAEGVWTGADPISLTAGTYQVTETPPAATPAGSWKTTEVDCNGTARRTVGTVSVTLAPGAGALCAFTNTFVPGGSLIVRKQTIGRTGDVGFSIARVSSTATTYEQVARVRETGRPTRAEGDDTTHIPLGLYRVTEFAVRQPSSGAWRLESVVCDGRPVTAARGQIEIRLTEENPKLDCTFTDRYDPGGTPDIPPAPQPPNPEENTAPSESELNAASGPFADLEITKRAVPANLRIGQQAHYEVVIVNHGPDPAQDVVGVELQPPSSRTLRLSTTKGTCDGRRPARCSVGTLQPGERVVVTTDTAPRQVGRVINRVATVSSTEDPNTANNEAQAAVRVRAPAPRSGSAPSFTG